jgi:hypothetical protein
MIKKPIALVMVGITAAILTATPVFAAKITLSDEAIAEVFGNANDSSTGGNSNVTASLAGDANGNIQINGYQWNDNHTSDDSQNKDANNQSGASSQVQKNISAKANALFVGAASQNVLINSGPVAGSQILTAYAVAANGGF